MTKKIDAFKPSPYLTFSIHLDGLREHHDKAVCQDGVFDKAVEAIRELRARGFRVNVKEMLEDGIRAFIVGRADEERVVELADHLIGTGVRAGDSMLLDVRSSILVEKLPKAEVEELVLEEVPDVSYEDIGGLADQIETIVDAVELPFLHADLFAEHELPAPKGILLYGPPGCGKTLIAKAVANSLAIQGRRGFWSKIRAQRSFFINIKGPELLNKYVGETERQIRLHLRTRAGKGLRGGLAGHRVLRRDGVAVPHPRQRDQLGHGIHVVPQLLAEIDGVETLRNVIVIGASNREDLIDPAILRPGAPRREDQDRAPRRVRRRSRSSARYLTTDAADRRRWSALADLGGGESDKAVRGMIERTVAEMYRSR